MQDQYRPTVIGQDILFHVGIDIFGQRDNLSIRRTLDRLLLALLQNRLAFGICLGGFHSHLGEAEETVVKHLGFHRKAVFLVGFIYEALIGTEDEIDAGIIQVNTLGADVLAALYKALAGID